ncbi:MAG: hypothetical protein NTW28_33570, partial [Candidatus Solibacter sp.]|nr:hypothetical protein [Candidatus Solibacter sp.]
MMRSILFAGFLAVSLAAAGQAPVEAKAPVKASVKDVAANPSRYAGSVLRVTGKLENEGANYF